MTRHPTPAVRPARQARTNPNDQGSLLMALLFTMMVSALCIAIMVSVMAGLKKADNSRDLALAQQAADIALADALMHANMRLIPGITTRSGITGSNANTVTWTWTATQTSPAKWVIDVEALGKNVDRHFRATLTRTPVIQGTWSDTNDDGLRDNIRYTAKNKRYFGSGFYATQNLELVTSGGYSPTVDGYNGGRGIIGSSGTINAGSGQFDLANLWNWKASDSLAVRCVGTNCTADRIRKYEQPLQVESLTGCTGTHQNDIWYASSGVRLKNDDCWASLVFDIDYNFAPATPTEQAWISVNGDVTIQSGINVGANPTRVYTKPTSWVLSVQGGEFNLAGGAIFSGAVYNPAGACSGDATGASATMWIGSGVCNSIQMYGGVRLRYDGAMANVERPSDNTTGPGVWNLRDFQIID